MKKEVLTFIVAFVIGICIAVGAASIYNHATTYNVEQYRFDHGLKITIDRNRWTARESGSKEYLGCYNNGTELVFVYMTDEEWKHVLFSYDENYTSKKEVLNKWRW